MTFTKLLPILIPSLALFVPFMVAFLNYRDRKDDLYRTDRHIKKLDLLARIELAIKAHPLDLPSDHQEIINKQLKDAVEFLMPAKKLISEQLEKFRAISNTRRILLLFKPASSVISLYRGFFFFSLIGAIISVFVMLFDQEFSFDSIAPIILYGLLAFLFRKLAVRKQIKKLSVG